MTTIKTFFLSCLAAIAQPAGYYDLAEGKTGGELRLALNKIIRNHTVVPYNSTAPDTSDALKILDEDPLDLNNVLLLYAQRSELKDTFGEVDGWNREHMWPNSYGLDDSGPEFSDLFNLRAEDSTVNSSRGNKFYDIADINDPNFRNPAHGEALGCESDTDSWSPPLSVRGDIARALFYMDVRYAGNPQNGEPDLVLTDNIEEIDSESEKMGRLSTLLLWHIQDPVSSEEQIRNEKIFKQYQYNRNPFVDRPEWVREIFWPQLSWFIEPGKFRPAILFFWDARYSARLEQALTLEGPWFPVKGLPAMDKIGWTQYVFPDQCEDPENCIEFYRLKLQ